jgi:beta-glucanase (GH16 family)
MSRRILRRPHTAALALAALVACVLPATLAVGEAGAASSANLDVASASGGATASAPATRLTAAAVSTTAPSGAALPPKTLKGWSRVFADDFTGTRLGSSWFAYSGLPGGNSAGWWAPSHATVGGGMLTLRGYRSGGKFVTAGVMNWTASKRLYGKYVVRYRAEAGQGVEYVLLLWPQAGWPPEVDFAGDNGGNRNHIAGTILWSPKRLMWDRNLAGNFTKWHTAGVEWRPNSLKLTLDGRVWATITGAAVPKVPMHLVLQSEALPCSQYKCVTSATPAHVNVYVDWVAVYKPA